LDNAVPVDNIPFYIFGVIPGEQCANNVIKRKAGAKYAQYVPAFHNLMVDPEKARMGDLVNVYIQRILV